MKELMRRRLSKRERKTAKRGALAKIKAEETQWIRERLAAMNLPEFVETTYKSLAKDRLKPADTIAMMQHYVDCHIVDHMDLPASKKRIMKALMNSLAISAKALSEPISRKSALKMFDQISTALAIDAQGGKTSKDALMKLRNILSEVQKKRAIVENSSLEFVEVPFSINKSWSQALSVLMGRTCGMKNLHLLMAANKVFSEIMDKLVER